MHQMKKLLLIIPILIWSCKDKQHADDLKVIDFFTNPGTEISKLSDIASDIKYINLHTSGTSGIDEIKVINDICYIKKRSSDEIECLNISTGNFLSKLAKKGRAADEYKYLGEFTVSSDGKLVAVHTYGDTIKIYENNGQDFRFLKSIDLADQPGNFSFVPQQYNLLISYFNHGTEPLIDVIIDLDGKTLISRSNHYKFKKIEHIPLTFVKNIHYKFNNTLHFKEAFNDTIFAADQSGMIRSYMVIDCHKKQVTPKFLSNQSLWNKSITENFNIITISETSRYLICYIVFRNTEYYGFYDKILNKYFKLNSESFLKDDISGGVNSQPIYLDGEKFFFWTDAPALKDHVSSESYINTIVKDPGKKASLKTLANLLKETNEQVLIVVTLKE
jgi:hypothetical protein